jgi:hypothetical protein
MSIEGSPLTSREERYEDWLTRGVLPRSESVYAGLSEKSGSWGIEKATDLVGWVGVPLVAMGFYLDPEMQRDMRKFVVNPSFRRNVINRVRKGIREISGGPGFLEKLHRSL